MESLSFHADAQPLERRRHARSSQRVLRRLLEIGWGIWYHIRDFKAMEESCG